MAKDDERCVQNASRKSLQACQSWEVTILSFSRSQSAHEPQKIKKIPFIPPICFHLHNDDRLDVCW
jgi:hypothetical protein